MSIKKASNTELNVKNVKTEKASTCKMYFNNLCFICNFEKYYFTL